jgi:hypothetical protein
LVATPPGLKRETWATLRFFMTSREPNPLDGGHSRAPACRVDDNGGGSVDGCAEDAIVGGLMNLVQANDK